MLLKIVSPILGVGGLAESDESGRGDRWGRASIRWPCLSSQGISKQERAGTSERRGREAKNPNPERRVENNSKTKEGNRQGWRFDVEVRVQNRKRTFHNKGLTYTVQRSFLVPQNSGLVWRFHSHSSRGKRTGSWGYCVPVHGVPGGPAQGVTYVSLSLPPSLHTWVPACHHP